MTPTERGEARALARRGGTPKQREQVSALDHQQRQQQQSGGGGDDDDRPVTQKELRDFMRELREQARDAVID